MPSRPPEVAGHVEAGRVLHGHAATRAPPGERADRQPRRADQADLRLAGAAPARAGPVPRLVLVSAAPEPGRPADALGPADLAPLPAQAHRIPRGRHL